MKKLFTFIAMALMAVSANADEITLWQTGDVVGKNNENGATAIDLGTNPDGWVQLYFLSDAGVELADAGAVAGDKLLFYATQKLADGYQVQIIEGHWGPQYAWYSANPLTDEKTGATSTVADLSTTPYLSLDLTKEILDAAKIQKWWGGSFVIQGYGIEITKVVLKTAVDHTSSALWEGECVFGNWENGFFVAADKFANAKEGDVMEYVYTTNTSTTENWYQLKSIFADTETTLSSNAAELNSYGCASVKDGSTSYKIKLNAEDVAQLKEKGLYTSGHYLTVTKVNLIQETTGISAINAVKQQNGVRYNLAGQKVDESYKGVVIMNGRKMVQK